MAKQAIRSETGIKPYDVQRIRQDFPALNQTVYGLPLIYLDNAATTQKPQAVIDAIMSFYLEDCSNVHRGVHLLSDRATKKYEAARIKVCRFINASSEKEIIFLRGATEAINLVAQTYGRQNVGRGDEIIISAMEHHSNIVPWQLLCEAKNAVLRVVPINMHGEFQFDKYEELLSARTKLVAITHVSNALGSVNPVQDIIALAHLKGVPVLVDGAQAAQHIPVDVQQLDCDFYALSGHKVYGPTGIGILYGKADLLESMPPWQGGGDMISSVTFEKTLYNKIPYKFEAGTPNIAGAIGLGAAVSYLQGLGLNKIELHERDLLAYATEALSNLPGVTIIGTARHKAAVLSFTVDGIHPHDIGTILDQEGIAIRTGHHCAQPVMDFFGVPATARASLGLYNTRGDIDALVAGISKVREVFN